MQDFIIITASTKEAAGAKTWLRERFTPSGVMRWLGEGVMSDYKEKMELLRETDDKIHEWTKDLDAIIVSILREIKKANKSNRLIDLANLLSLLNSRMVSVVEEGKHIERVTEESIREFEKEQHFKGAGYWSDFKREWVANKLQNNYRKERSRALTAVVNSAVKAVDKVKVSLNKMSKFRASGDIGKYIEELKVISGIQKEFSSFYQTIYNKYLKSLVDEVNAQQKEEEVAKPATPATTNHQEVPDLQVPSTDSPESDYEDSRVVPDLKAPTKTPVIEEEFDHKPEHKEIEMDDDGTEVEPFVGDKDVIPMTEEEQEAALLASKSASFNKKRKHAQFLNAFAKMAALDSMEAGQMLLTYSAKIEDEDLETSLKLLAIAEGILDG